MSKRPPLGMVGAERLAVFKAAAHTLLALDRDFARMLPRGEFAS